jgi:hypothetical protein
MSSAVVPRNADFAQQGNVDWVALSNSTANFSIALLARLSKAGIDAFTIQMGRAICSDFIMTPSVQQGLVDAIQKLKKYGSYGNVIWFGFGIKHIVIDLSETEEGLACVGLCASLSIVYGTMCSAQVLRELCRLRKAPDTFTPALQQWKVLVTLCSGILTSHRFNLHLNGFRRLISQELHYPILSCQTATAPPNLARAILAIAHISKERLLNVTFTGGLDCAWLAAYAEELLSLNIEILGSTGMPLYRSRSDVVAKPHVKFLIYDGTKTEQISKNISISKSSLIESGRTLIGFSSDSKVLHWRAPWATILHETFHEAIDQLLHDMTGRHFAMYLYCVSNLQNLYLGNEATEGNTRWVKRVFPMIWKDERSRGRRLLQFAAERLPELASLIQYHLPDVLLGASEINALDALRVIQESCSCSKDKDELDTRNRVCLFRLTNTILSFLWVLLASEIEEDVHPLISGLIYLYNRQIRRCGDNVQDLSPSSFLAPHTGLQMILNIFSGTVTGSPFAGAASNEGICVYQNMIENPDQSPTSIANFRIVRGYIAHAGTFFKEIQFIEHNNDLDASIDSSNLVRNLSSNMIVETVVEETDDERILELGFRVTYAEKINDPRRCIWLDFRCILNILRVLRADERCDHVLDLKRFPSVLISWTNYSKWGVSFKPGSVDMVQALNPMKFDFDTWMLMVLEDNMSTFIRLYAIDRYLSLYSLISNNPENILSLRSFSSCLACLLEGALSRINDTFPHLDDEMRGHSMSSRGTMELVSGDTNTIQMEWTIPDLEVLLSDRRVRRHRTT